MYNLKILKPQKIQTSSLSLYFEEEGHKYYLIDREGVIKHTLPSVSQILQTCLVSFYVKKELLAIAAARGTAVHRATEEWDKFGTESGLLQLKGWKKFLDEYSVKINSVESCYFHKEYLYAGTIDRLVEIDGEHHIIVIKSGVKADWHAVQLSGYNHMLGLKYKRGCVYLDKEGGYKFIKYERDEDHDAFIAALMIARWKGIWNPPKKRGRKKKSTS